MYVKMYNYREKIVKKKKSKERFNRYLFLYNCRSQVWFQMHLSLTHALCNKPWLLQLLLPILISRARNFREVRKYMYLFVANIECREPFDCCLVPEKQEFCSTITKNKIYKGYEMRHGCLFSSPGLKEAQVGIYDRILSVVHLSVCP